MMTSVSRCPACGAFAQADDRFCWSCGLELRAAPLAAPEASAPAVLELDPKVALALRRAHLAQQRGRLEDAEELVRSALREDPDSVPALSMLARVLRAKGDPVGSVAAAQRVSELVGQDRAPAPPGAVAKAREDRAQVEEQVVREIVGGASLQPATPLDLFAAQRGGWSRSRRVYAALVVVGLAALFLGLVAVLRGALSGYLWFAISMLAAGWCYHDAETRGLAALLWASFVLCLGPFGLAIYLLATR
jgi:tetratricopeptide (TPR) repeat protein